MTRRSRRAASDVVARASARRLEIVVAAQLAFDRAASTLAGARRRAAASKAIPHRAVSASASQCAGAKPRDARTRRAHHRARCGGARKSPVLLVFGALAQRRAAAAERKRNRAGIARENSRRAVLSEPTGSVRVPPRRARAEPRAVRERARRRRAQPREARRCGGIRSIGSLHPGSSSNSSLQSGRAGIGEQRRPSAQTVSRHDRDALESGEHVELRDHEARQAIERDGVSRRDRIEPAATPRTPRHGAELAALSAQSLAALVVQLGWERSGADARAVGLEHADNSSDRARSDAEAGAGAPAIVCELVTYGYVPYPTSSSEPCAPSSSTRLPSRQPFVNVCDAVDDVRRQSRFAASCRRILRRSKAAAPATARQQIGKSHAGARDAIHVGGPDAAAGRSDRDGARALARLISRHVMRKDDVRPIRDFHARDVDADRCRAHRALAISVCRLTTVPPPTKSSTFECITPEGTIRNASSRSPTTIECPGVIAAAEARDHVVVCGIQVDDASLSFVAPLQSEDNVGFRRRAVTGQNSLRRPPRTDPSNPLSRRDSPTVWPGDIPSPARSLRPAPRRLPYLLC